MYKQTRQNASDILWISTRSIDRYIKSWKLRSRKEWKIVYIHSDDLKNLTGDWIKKQEIIYKSQDSKTINYDSKKLLKESHLENIYIDLRNEIKEKDLIIRDLSIKLGEAQEVAKNSVSLMDFKKSQFLLEESKEHLSQRIEDMEFEKSDLEYSLKYQKTNNLILIIALIFIFSTACAIFILKI